MPKFNTYVGVFVNGKVKFVTGVDKGSVFWENGKEVMEFSESFARDIVFGLTVYGFPCAVMKFPNGVELSNEEE